MEMKKEVIFSEINLTEDGRGLSIPIRFFVEIDGEKFYKQNGEVTRVAFCSFKYNEEGEEVTNQEFKAEVTTFTGDKDFFDKFNFVV